MAFDPEGEVAYYHEPHEAGRPNYAVLGPTGFGDRGTFYGWLEEFLGWATSPARPLSPAPVASHFASADAFRAEQARWFRDHGDGCELQGSRADHNRLFDRLRDKLFGYRRHRANPSGTTRADMPHASSRVHCPVRSTRGGESVSATLLGYHPPPCRCTQMCVRCIAWLGERLASPKLVGQ